MGRASHQPGYGAPRPWRASLSCSLGTFSEDGVGGEDRSKGNATWEAPLRSTFTLPLASQHCSSTWWPPSQSSQPHTKRQG